MRSLFDLHAQGGDDAEIAKRYAVQHAGSWEAAEEHWEQLVMTLLQTSDMEALGVKAALRRAESEVRNLLAVTVHATGGKCPLCSRTQPDTLE